MRHRPYRRSIDTTMPRWASDGDLDSLIASGNPFPEPRTGSVRIVSAAIALRDAIPTQPQPRVRWWTAQPSKRVAFACVAAVFLVASAGAVWGAHIGTFGPPGYTESDTSEYLRADTADILNVINGYTAKYTLPPGGSWNGLKNTYPKPSGYCCLQATGLEGEIALDSYCQWRAFWITSFDAHDAATLAQAQKIIDAYPTWPITPKFSGADAMSMWHEVAALARSGNGAEMKRLQPLQCGGPATQP